MVYEIRFSDQAIKDLDQIADHLAASFLGFGDTVGDAYDKAAKRVLKLTRQMVTLENHPYRGTVASALRSGLRYLSIERAVVYFEVEESAETIHVLSVFFGGQDHQRHMIERLIGRKSSDS